MTSAYLDCISIAVLSSPTNKYEQQIRSDRKQYYLRRGRVCYCDLKFALSIPSPTRLFLHCQDSLNLYLNRTFAIARVPGEVQLRCEPGDCIGLREIKVGVTPTYSSRGDMPGEEGERPIKCFLEAVKLEGEDTHTIVRSATPLPFAVSAEVMVETPAKVRESDEKDKKKVGTDGGSTADGYTVRKFI